jgi:hypothetical protein
MSLSRAYPEARATRAKVFWFFFSKKTCFFHFPERATTASTTSDTTCGNERCASIT